MGVIEIAARSLLDEELEAVIETGLYDSKEAFLAHAVEVLLTARPELREAVACKLYEKGVLSIGRTAELAGLSIEDIKEALHRRGISRESNDSLEEMEEMARLSLRTLGTRPQRQQQTRVR
jgi:predicted HTH domain antitoxin